MSAVALDGWRPRLLLLDLDGTLADSGPDLVRALQGIRQRLGFAPVESTQVVRCVSKGGRAVLRAGFPELDAEQAEAHLDELLTRYRQSICVDTRLFDGMAEVLDNWSRAGGLSGIVTNKPAFLTNPLVEALGVARLFCTVVSGDTLATRKPDPGPVLHACAEAGVAPADTLFVGDDRRDIDAGRAAGTRTATAEWGYLDGEDPADWGADMRLSAPRQLVPWLS